MIHQILIRYASWIIGKDSISDSVWVIIVVLLVAIFLSYIIHRYYVSCFINQNK